MDGLPAVEGQSCETNVAGFLIDKQLGSFIDKTDALKSIEIGHKIRSRKDSPGRIPQVIVRFYSRNVRNKVVIDFKSLRRQHNASHGASDRLQVNVMKDLTVVDYNTKRRTAPMITFRTDTVISEVNGSNNITRKRVMFAGCFVRMR